MVRMLTKNFYSSLFYYLGLCHQGAWKLPSGKWICVVLNSDGGNIKKTYDDSQQFCKDNGFDRLLEPQTLEDSKFVHHMLHCK